jgi:hypothetical protein
MEGWTAMHPVISIVIGLIGLVWVVLLVLLPFIVEGIRAWTIKNNRELTRINANLEKLNALLAGRARAQHPSGAPAPAARREPTISDFEVEAGEDRKRRP